MLAIVVIISFALLSYFRRWTAIWGNGRWKKSVYSISYKFWIFM